MVDTPYRAPDETPRFVCIVCFGMVSTAPTSCLRCGAPLSPLDDFEVATAVRSHAIGERAKINRKKTLTVMLPAGLLSVVLFFALIAAGVPLDYTSKTVGGGTVAVPYFIVSFLVWSMVFASLYPRVSKQSEARLQFDPVNGDLPSVLEWLGLRVQLP